MDKLKSFGVKYKTIILAMTGSVASIKANELVEKLLGMNLNVIFIQTTASQHFTQNQYLIDEFKINQARKDGPFFAHFFDPDEYTSWSDRGDPVLHIELRNLADLLLIAPLSANTLAKVANGICDNLVTNIARCWPYKKVDNQWQIQKPLVVAPAMNT